MRPLLAQIEAIASHTVGPDADGPAYRVGELLTIRQTLAGALAKVDAYLTWRVEERRKRQGREPDPRNGTVCACESHRVEYVGDEEVETFDSYMVVHMSRSGNSTSVTDGYKTLAEAEAAAMQEARRRNAILI
jgi:hypothetical protein